MSLKAKVEAIIYAAEEPITLEQISQLLREVVLAELAADKENAAIEQADSVAEALAADANATIAVEAAASASEKTALLPELAADSEELICPESGPLMPQVAVPEDAVFTDAAQSESVAESLEKAVSANEASEQTASEDMVSESVMQNSAESTAAASASVSVSDPAARKRQPKKSEREIAEDKAVRARVREILVELVTDYTSEAHGIEIRQVAGGFRMATKPEHHDVVRAFAKSLKPPIRLSLAALETLAVIAYKQPITGPEISDIRGVESAGVLGTLLDRKLITTAGRKQVIGRPMQYKTSKDFLLRFGMNDVNELPSMEEFSQLAFEGTIEIAPAETHQSSTLFESRTATQDSIQPLEKSASEAHEQGEQLLEAQEVPKQQPDTAVAADSQPQLETAESNNVPETEHPIGQ
jgi:segregation and condensation protein B